MPVDSNLDLAKATRAGLPSTAAVLLAREILEIPPAVDASLWPALGGTVVGQALGAQTLGVLGGLVFSLVGAIGHHTPRRLTPSESDLVVRTAAALSKAIDVLGEKSKAAHWLKSPNTALGGQTPLSLLDTSAGEHEVEALLDRIEYGVYS